jgi:diacylglycerol kinase (ATP)
MAREIWPSIVALLDHLGLPYELLSLTGRASLADEVGEHLAAAGSAGYRAIAGIGGDGTHSGIINAIMRLQAGAPGTSMPPYAFVPVGTGNDIAKSLGIRIEDAFSSRDLRRAVSAIAHGADYRLDLGLLGGRYFADALTVGLDSRILRERNSRKRLIEGIPVIRSLVRGRFLYTLSLGSRFFQQELVEGEIAVDGAPWYRGPMLNVVINNTRIYAGDFDFSADAHADDGLLDVVLFTDHTDYLARYLLAIRHNSARVREWSADLHRRSRHVQGRRISIRLSRAESAQIDGEEMPDGAAFDVDVAPRALHIKIPAEPV